MTGCGPSCTRGATCSPQNEDPPVPKTLGRVIFGRKRSNTLETLPGKASSQAAEIPVPVKDVIRMLCSLSDKKKMRVPVQPSNKSGQMAVTGALIGTILGGPPGLIVGSVFGGLLGAGMKDEPFTPVCKILLQLSQDSQQKLLDKVKAVIWNLDWMDSVELMDLVIRSERLQRQLVDVLVDFIKTQLKTDVEFDI